MSGFLDIKLCAKGNRSLTPWKAWKKQWCILRPSPLKEGGISIIFHTSAGLTSNSKLEVPRHSLVYRTESKSKTYSFGIFPTSDNRKPILFLAGQSESDSQLWIGRIRSMLHGNKTEKPDLHDGFNVSLIDNAFTNLCSFKGLYGYLTVSSEGFQISDNYNSTCKAFLPWNYISEIRLTVAEKNIDKNRICSITTNREFEFGHGEILLFCHCARSLVKTLQQRSPCDSPEVTLRKLNRRISRSEGALLGMRSTDDFECLQESQRDSGLSSCGPISSESNIKWDSSRDESYRVSVDENGFVLKGMMASTLISAGLMLSTPRFRTNTSMSLEQVDDVLSPLHRFPDTLRSSSFNRRCSGASIASGIYEEISESTPTGLDSRRSSGPDSNYEVLPDCCPSRRRVSRKVPPPPLPPRTKNSSRLDSASDSGMEEDSLCSTPHDNDDAKWTYIHESVSTLPRFMSLQKDPCSLSSKFNPETSSNKSAYRNRDRLNSALDVFRKRIKSDSQVPRDKSFDCDSSSYQGSDNIPTRKRLFDFNVTPIKSMHMIRNSKVGRAIRKLGGKGNISGMKTSAKSCETLDCDDIITTFETNRCSKSVENLDYRHIINSIDDRSYEEKESYFNLSTEWCLETDGDNIKDLSAISADSESKFTFPQHIFDLVLQGNLELAKQKMRQKVTEEDYVMMSPCGRVSINNTKSIPSISIIEPPTIAVEDNYTIMKSAY